MLSRSLVFRPIFAMVAGAAVLLGGFEIDRSQSGKRHLEADVGCGIDSFRIDQEQV